MTALDRQQRILRVGWIGLFLAGGAAFYRLDPARGFGLTCPFHAYTGLDCFGCGLTRSLWSALHGDIVSAFGYHVAGPIILGLMMAAALVWLYEAMTGHRHSLLRSGNVRWGAIVGTGAVWILYGTVRMIVEVTGTWMR